MKFRLLAALVALSTSTAALAQDTQILEGEFNRANGSYYILANDAKHELTNIDFNVDSIKNGQ